MNNQNKKHVNINLMQMDGLKKEHWNGDVKPFSTSSRWFLDCYQYNGFHSENMARMNTLFLIHKK